MTFPNMTPTIHTHSQKKGKKEEKREGERGRGRQREGGREDKLEGWFSG